MKKANKKILSLILLILLFASGSQALFAESTTPEPYNTEEFPQSLKDLRRFEIVSLGAMPFVMLDTTIGYSAYKSIFKGAAFNLFDTSSYTQDETINIICTSLAISASIGLTDFIINLVTRNLKNKKNQINTSSYMNVIPIAEDPDAIKIENQNLDNSLINDNQINDEQNIEEELKTEPEQTEQINDNLQEEEVIEVNE